MVNLNSLNKIKIEIKYRFTLLVVLDSPLSMWLHFWLIVGDIVWPVNSFMHSKMWVSFWYIVIWQKKGNSYVILTYKKDLT
jgi:hypothetical protein